jgi:hypothetical protein
MREVTVQAGAARDRHARPGSESSAEHFERLLAWLARRPRSAQAGRTTV